MHSLSSKLEKKTINLSNEHRQMTMLFFCTILSLSIQETIRFYIFVKQPLCLLTIVNFSLSLSPLKSFDILFFKGKTFTVNYDYLTKRVIQFIDVL